MRGSTRASSRNHRGISRRFNLLLGNQGSEVCALMLKAKKRELEIERMNAVGPRATEELSTPRRRASRAEVFFAVVAPRKPHRRLPCKLGHDRETSGHRNRRRNRENLTINISSSRINENRRRAREMAYRIGGNHRNLKSLTASESANTPMLRPSIIGHERRNRECVAEAPPHRPYGIVV